MSDDNLLLPSVRAALPPLPELAPMQTRVVESFDGRDEFIHFHTYQDVEPILDSAAELRSNGLTGTKDFRHAGRIPMNVLEMWLQEAGVAFHDSKAVNEVIKRKLMDGEFSKLRVWEGRF